MVHIRLERLPPRANKKLHPCNTGSYKILKKISSNAYVQDVPSDSGANSTFNVENRTLYRGHDTDGDIEEQILPYMLFFHLLTRLLMCLMTRLFLLVKEFFRSFTFVGGIILSSMQHGSLLQTSST